MSRLATSAWVAVLLGSVQAIAAPAYEFNDLHVHLGFNEAVAVVAELGGHCELDSLRHGEIVTANCTFQACAEERADGKCDKPLREYPTLETGPQPIVRVGLKAPGTSSRLSKIAIVFNGDPEEVARSLVQRYGEPLHDSALNSEKSWTHSRRLHWKTGEEVMGLLKLINTITLNAN